MSNTVKRKSRKEETRRLCLIKKFGLAQIQAGARQTLIEFTGLPESYFAPYEFSGNLKEDAIMQSIQLYGALSRARLEAVLSGRKLTCLKILDQAKESGQTEV